MNIFQAGAATQQSLISSLFSSGSPAQSQGKPASSGNADTPATIVSLSDQAKAALAQAESNAAAADTLAQAVSSQAGKTPATGDFSWDDFLDFDIAEPDPNKVLQPVSREQQIATMTDVRQKFLIGNVARHNPDAFEGLKAAIANGAVTIRKAENVPGVNYKTTVTEIPGGTKSEVSFNPSPEIQAQIDSGRAAVMWHSKLGDIYLSW